MSVHEQVEQDGFAVIDADAVADGTVERLIERLDASVDHDGDRQRRGSVFARRNVLADPAIRAFADGEAARRWIVPTLGPAARPVRAILFDKTPEANWTVPWHQDRSIAVESRVDTPGFGPWSEKSGVVHVQPPLKILRSMLTLRVHLDACGEEAGPLRVIPQTHNDILTPAEVDEAVAAGPQVACTTRRGGAVLMRPLALHASSPAKVPNHRRVLHIEYAGLGLPAGLRWYF